ncbi:MAG: SpoIIE family protein phosphatase, partial [Cryomorphaceae bacterium]
MTQLSIKSKLILAFSIIAMVASCNTIVQYYYNRKVKELESYAKKVESLNALVLKTQVFHSRFVMNDLSSSSFFENRSSVNLDLLNESVTKEFKTITELEELALSDKKLLSHELSNLRFQLEQLNYWYSQFEKLNLRLGYEDYGFMGRMRGFAHLLEDNYSTIIPTEELLMLRRHEKDFFLRKNEKYRTKFNERIARIKSKLAINGQDKELQKCLHLLGQYEASFNQVCDYKIQIGFTIEEEGVQAVIREKTNEILSIIHNLEREVQSITDRTLVNLNFFFILGLALTTAVTIFIVLWLSGLMTRSIMRLSFHVKTFVGSNFEGKFESNEFEKRGDEIGDLYQNFKRLSEEVTVHFRNYRENAEVRHREIVAKNSKIEEQKSLLEIRESMLTRRNESLMDSILYAKRIQTALFPGSDLLRSLLGECISIFKPKAVVSGDFHWVEETKDSVYFAVGDCTGHGVPGAFMSILAYNQLDQAIKYEGIKSPGTVLNFLDEKISYLLNKNQTHEVVKDGMDIILCRFRKQEGYIEFASANRPLLVLKNGQVMKLKGERRSIGALNDYKNSSFSTQIYVPEIDDTLFLTTDGYTDQFGGDFDKKIKMSGLVHKLESTA